MFLTRSWQNRFVIVQSYNIYLANLSVFAFSPLHFILTLNDNVSVTLPALT